MEQIENLADEVSFLRKGSASEAKEAWEKVERSSGNLHYDRERREGGREESTDGGC